MKEYRLSCWRSFKHTKDRAFLLNAADDLQIHVDALLFTSSGVTIVFKEFPLHQLKA